jgi:hypothetical protein
MQFKCSESSFDFVPGSELGCTIAADRDTSEELWERKLNLLQCL